MQQTEKISPEDCTIIQAEQARVKELRAAAEKAIDQWKIADLQAQTVLLRAFLKYGLQDGDRIDTTSGAIIRAAKPEVEPQPMLPQHQAIMDQADGR